MPFLTFPLALLALSSLPMLAGIYWLRNRYRRQVVSSLCLWEHANPAKEGGRRIEKLQTPLLFLLELLVLGLLAFGATGPRASTTSTHVPLTVVLDDSYSMLAGDAMSPRALAMDAMRDELRRGNFATRFILAGSQPVLLGEATHRHADAIRQLEGWRCRASVARLDRAIALAAELGGPTGRILVVTDHAAPYDIPDGTLQWWAFGRARDNVAFVGAARGEEGDKPRCMFEVANLGAKSVTTRLKVERALPEPGKTALVVEQPLTLEPMQSRQVFLDLPDGAGAIHAQLADDDLPADNRLVLLPPPARTVRIALDLADENLRKLMLRSFEAIPHVTLASDRPDLIVTDKLEVERSLHTWTLRVILDEPAVPYLGPFVVDHAHPLGEGLQLEGVIWAASKAEDEAAGRIAGRPVVTAGNVVLLADDSPTSQSHDLRLRLRPDLSTLTRSPGWPILMWNLVQWRRSYLPGPVRTNLRTDDEAVVTLAPGTKTAALLDPAGDSREFSARNDQLHIPLALAGEYRLATDKGEYLLAANVLHRAESDLAAGRAGKWGRWISSPQLQHEYRSILWLFAAGALLLLVLHMVLVARSSGKGARL